MAYAPSVEPVVENAQQLPHLSWFLMEVTAPFATQSTESGTVVLPSNLWTLSALPIAGRAWLSPMRSMNCSLVRSEYSLWPREKVRPFALCDMMISSLASHASKAAASASTVS